MEAKHRDRDQAAPVDDAVGRSRAAEQAGLQVSWAAATDLDLDLADAFDEAEMLSTDDELTAPPSDRGGGPEESAMACVDDLVQGAEELQDELTATGVFEDELEQGVLDIEVDDAEVELEDETLDAVDADEAESAPVDEAVLEAGFGDELEPDLGLLLDRRLGRDVAAGEGDEELEVPTEPEDEAAVIPRRAGEFVCTSCFLVKARAQLADPVTGSCVDCVQNNRPAARRPSRR